MQKEKESDADTSAYYVVSFSYDSRDMLVEEKYQRWDSGTSTWDNMYWARYKYDTAGNMTYREVDQIVNGSPKQYFDGPFTYSRGYQLTGFTRKGSFGAETRTFTLTYDANGNMTHISQSATFTDTFYNITEMEFQFDAKNRMTHYRFGGAGSYHQIKYDALGRVRERVNLTPTTSKYYSDGRQLIQQLDNSDNVDFDYFRGPTGLMRQVDVDASNKKRFYIKDPLGTVLALVNPSDLSVTHYNYNAWGEHLDKDDTDFPTDENPMRYIGCRVEAFGDSTTQTDAIYHLDHRHYLPFHGIFIHRDPLTLLAPKYYVEKPYSYSNNKPSNSSDPTGLLDCCKDAGAKIVADPWLLQVAVILWTGGIAGGGIGAIPEFCYYNCETADLLFDYNPGVTEDECPRLSAGNCLNYDQIPDYYNLKGGILNLPLLIHDVDIWWFEILFDPHIYHHFVDWLELVYQNWAPEELTRKIIQCTIDVVHTSGFMLNHCPPSLTFCANYNCAMPGGQMGMGDGGLSEFLKRSGECTRELGRRIAEG